MPDLSARTLTLAAFAAALATIAAAWGFQLIGGFMPCELCYLQRWPYYIGVPVLALTLIVWDRAPREALTALIAVSAAIFIWSTYLGAYHAGVEWKFWPGPDTCSGLGGDLDFSRGLGNLDDATFVPCDRAQVRFFGLSFAGLNALASLGLAVMLAWAALKRMQPRAR